MRTILAHTRAGWLHTSHVLLASQMPTKTDRWNCSMSTHTSNANSGHSSKAVAKSPQSSGTNRHHSAGHLIIELGEHAHQAVESTHKFLERGNSGFKIVSGIKAYKDYSWIKNAPIKTLNEFTGKRRAIIISKGWKFAHDVTIHNADKLEKFGDYLSVAGIAIEIAKSHEKIRAIHASKDSNSLAAQRYITLGSMAVFKSVSAPILPITRLLTQGIVKAATLAHAPYGDIAMNARAVNLAVHSSYNQLMDSDNVVHYINTHLVIK